MSCGAINCSASKKKNPERIFHCFPSDPVRSKRWVQQTRRADLVDKSHIYLYECVKLCSNHFEPCMYIEGSKRLRIDAEPTLFDIPNPPNRKSAKRRPQVRVPERGQKRAHTQQGDGTPKAKRRRVESGKKKTNTKSPLTSSKASGKKTNGETSRVVRRPRKQLMLNPMVEIPLARHNNGSNRGDLATHQMTEMVRRESKWLSTSGCQRCCVANCGASEKTHPRRKFFAFPTDQQRCNLWVAACRRPTLMKVSHAELMLYFKVCAVHFDPLSISPISGQLRPGAVPMRFNVTPEPKRKDSEGTEMLTPTMVENTCFGELTDHSQIVPSPGLIISSVSSISSAHMPTENSPSTQSNTSGAAMDRQPAQYSQQRESRDPLKLELPPGAFKCYVEEVQKCMTKLKLLETSRAKLLAQGNILQIENGDHESKRGTLKVRTKEFPCPPLLTLRENPGEVFQVIRRLHPLSDELSRPLSPLEAWFVISKLKLKLLKTEARVFETENALKKSQIMMCELRTENNDALRSMQKRTKELKRCLQKTMKTIEPNILGPEEKPTQAMKRLMQELSQHRMKNKNLLQRFTPAQVHSLQTGSRMHSFSVEDLKRALELRRRVSRAAYSYIRKKLGVPLPTPQVLHRSALRHKALRELNQQVLRENLRRMPFNRKFHLKSEPVHPNTMKDRKRILGLPTRIRKKKSSKMDQLDSNPSVFVSERSNGNTVELVIGDGASMKSDTSTSHTDTTRREQGCDGMKSRHMIMLQGIQTPVSAVSQAVAEEDGNERNWDDYLLEDLADASVEEMEDGFQTDDELQMEDEEQTDSDEMNDREREDEDAGVDDERKNGLGETSGQWLCTVGSSYVSDAEWTTEDGVKVMWSSDERPIAVRSVTGIGNDGSPLETSTRAPVTGNPKEPGADGAVMLIPESLYREVIVAPSVDSETGAKSYGLLRRGMPSGGQLVNSKNERKRASSMAAPRVVTVTRDPLAKWNIYRGHPTLDSQ